MGKIGVTGATGQFGSTVIESLLARGVQPQDLRATTRDTGRASALQAQGIEVRRGDFDDSQALRQAFEGVERLLVISTDQVGARVEQHRRAVLAAKEAGVKQIAYTSIVDMGERDGQNVLAADHRATERIILDSGIPYTLLRNTFYAELMVQPVIQALDRGVFVSSAGEARLGAASRADLAEAAAVVLSQPGHAHRTYELTYPRPWDYRELAGVVSRVSGRAMEYRPVSGEEMEQILQQAGLPGQNIQMVLGMNASLRAGDISKTGGDLEQVLGRPVTSLEAIVRKLLPGA